MIDKQATKTLLWINTFQLRKTQQKQIVFKIAFVNQVQNIERQVSRKMATNKFLEKKEQMVTKNDSVKQTQMSWKQERHKDWKQSLHSAETEQSRYFDRNLVCQKSTTLAINEKTRLALLIVGDISKQDAPCPTGNYYWTNNCLTLTQTTRKTSSKRKNYKSWK